ncbi:MAG: hypothetical protein MI743_04700, partial [Sneathiellales bacterium]|nr:hypothetical protein [Sneathiellales bacterium]
TAFNTESIENRELFQTFRSLLCSTSLSNQRLNRKGAVWADSTLTPGKDMHGEFNCRMPVKFLRFL